MLLDEKQDLDKSDDPLNDQMTRRVGFLAVADDVKRAEFLDLYRLAVEEYRFQVNLNWQRTQYLLAFNAGVLGLAIGLLGGPGGRVPVLTGFLCLFGAAAALASIVTRQTQHGYYRQTREHLKALEMVLDLSDTT